MTDPRPLKRDRAATEVRILNAVRTLLARDGFAALRIKAVAAEAGVDKVLIYRYFGKLDELLTAFGRHTEFWPAVEDVLSPDNDVLPLTERLSVFFERLIDALRARPLTVEILVMEVAAANSMTASLHKAREEWAAAVAARIETGISDMANRAEIDGAIGLLVAGIQQLLMRARRSSVFGTLDIGSEAGWRSIKANLAFIVDRLVTAPAADATASGPDTRRPLIPRKDPPT